MRLRLRRGDGSGRLSELPSRASRPGRDWVPEEEEVDAGGSGEVAVEVEADVGEADVEAVVEALGAEWDAAVTADGRCGWASAGEGEGEAGVGAGDEGDEGALSPVSLPADAGAGAGAGAGVAGGVAAVEAPGNHGSDTDAEADDVDTPPLPRDAGMSEGETRRARGVAGRCYGRRDAGAGSRMSLLCFVRDRRTRPKFGVERLVGFADRGVSAAPKTPKTGSGYPKRRPGEKEP